ncbi:MAG TPA: acyl-CoA dehydrogenase family protein [Pseudonocardia sp.]|jgi:alkylation response protein AidB-like acyl-CoA dehydrogenase|nr:acyl-CoA dehydrogenase family protein [Pseudonocardia sp.]
MLARHWPEEIELLRKTVRDLAVRRVAPLVEGIETSGSFSPVLMDVLKGAGLTGLIVPAAHGGVDADLRSFVVVMEELSQVFPTASTMLTPHWFSTKQIVKWGDAPWVAPLLARVAEGDGVGAIALTEPEAGSDLASVTTKAVRTGDSYVIDGQKRFITNGGQCDYYTLLARTGGPGARGLSLIYVEADRPGLSIGRVEKKMGLRGSATAEVLFDGVTVPADHLIGTENRGFAQAMDGIEEGRVVVAAMSLGIAQGALDHAVSYAKTRRQFGKPIGAFQGLQFMLADMAIKVDAARSLVYDAAEAVMARTPDAARLASAAKTYASDAAMEVATDAVQVLGGYGYVSDFPVEMLMRDAKINQIYEGTNQIQRMLIARGLLGAEVTNA